MVVVDGANHSQKDDVEGNRGSLMKDGAEAFVLFLPGAKLVLRSSVLTVLDLEVDVMLENAENLGRCCLGKVDPQMAGSAAEVLQVSLRCPLPLLRTHPHSLVVCCFFVFAEMGATSTASRRLGKPIFVWEAGWNEPLWYDFSFSCNINLKVLRSQPFAAAYIHETKQGPSEPVLLMALEIMLHAKLCLLVINFLIACAGPFSRKG